MSRLSLIPLFPCSFIDRELDAQSKLIFGTEIDLGCCFPRRLGAPPVSKARELSNEGAEPFRFLNEDFKCRDNKWLFTIPLTD